MPKVVYLPEELDDSYVEPLDGGKVVPLYSELPEIVRIRQRNLVASKFKSWGELIYGERLVEVEPIAGGHHRAIIELVTRQEWDLAGTLLGRDEWIGGFEVVLRGSGCRWVAAIHTVGVYVVYGRWIHRLTTATLHPEPAAAREMTCRLALRSSLEAGLSSSRSNRAFSFFFQVPHLAFR